ncbi:MAG: ABC transporter ATP-binding protein [Herpetosiphon sp.]
MISATDLHKWFGSFHAVRGISLAVAPGEVLALLGPNGAGKTTTVRMLSAMLPPTTGHAIVAGYNVATAPQSVRASIGLLTEYPGLYARMRGWDYLLFFADLLSMSRADGVRRAELLLHQFGLWDARHRKLDGYSKGMKQKMALIRAMLHDPPVLFLDEPTTAMDPQSAHVVRDAIAELRSARRSIVLCTHNLAEAEYLADRIAVVQGGVVVAQGTPAELTRSLLGDPFWELRIVPGPAPLPPLDDLVTLQSSSANVLRYRTSEAEHCNPQLLARLHGAGVPVVSLSELPHSLESVYLRIVAQSASQPQP